MYFLYLAQFELGLRHSEISRSEDYVVLQCIVDLFFLLLVKEFNDVQALVL